MLGGKNDEITFNKCIQQKYIKIVIHSAVLRGKNPMKLHLIKAFKENDKI